MTKQKEHSQKRKRVLFYSSVDSMNLFKTQQFYVIDGQILNTLGYEVIFTNKMVDFLKFWTYNIAFIYFYRYGVVPAFFARLLGKKVYFTGGIDLLDKGYATEKRFQQQKMFFKACYALANKCILVSNTDKKNVQAIYGSKPLKKLSFSFHTINPEQFRISDLNKKDKLITTIVWMGTVANVKRKGVDRSLALFKQLTTQKEFKDYRFLIIGKQGTGTNYLKGIIKALDLENKVEFSGEITESDKIDYLKKSTFYAQLSTYEGFGVAALEALAAGNVVLHSGRGGLADCIAEYGKLFNIEQLPDGGPELAKDLAEALSTFDYNTAFNYIESNFSTSKREADFKEIIG